MLFVSTNCYIISSVVDSEVLAFGVNYLQSEGLACFRCRKGGISSFRIHIWSVFFFIINCFAENEMQYKLKPNIALRTPAEIVILIFYISHYYDFKLC